MGVSISAKNSKYDFNMGYIGFFWLRKNIATALDKNFGDNYKNLISCHTQEDFKEHDRIANMIIEKNELDEDIVEFLYAPDTNGKISYKVCKKIYDLIKDIDFGNEHFRYGAYAHNDYEEFKEFLKECYAHHRNMYWE